MSQGFKLKYDEIRQNDITTPFEQGDANDASYSKEGYVRNICFVHADGKRIFLNYGYLVSGEYSPETNTILLGFTTHSVILVGIHLESLFYELMHHLPKQIICTDARYNQNGEDGKPLVNEIHVSRNS